MLLRDVGGDPFLPWSHAIVQAMVGGRPVVALSVPSTNARSREKNRHGRLCFFGSVAKRKSGECAKIKGPISIRAFVHREVIEVDDDSPDEVTQLLAAWSDGDRSALDKLLPLVERELHHLAHRYISHEKPGHTLQTTALVNEAYLRLVNQKRARWHNRSHFFAIAAQIMRRILVNHARDRAAGKRGGGARKVSLDDAAVLSDERAAEIVALDEALDSLAKLDERKSRVVELRYFGGLSVKETAELLGIHPDTVTREWGRAKAFLRREIQKADRNERRTLATS
jgi:RNA polymerase sigma factor (TIGR02999 family)